MPNTGTSGLVAPEPKVVTPCGPATDAQRILI